MNLPGIHIQTDWVIGYDTRITLGDPAHLEPRRWGLCDAHVRSFVMMCQEKRSGRPSRPLLFSYRNRMLLLSWGLELATRHCGHCLIELRLNLGSDQAFVVMIG